MEKLTLLNVFFNDYDITYLVVILGIYGFFALCRIDNALESATPTIQAIKTGARIVKMTAVLLLLSFSGLSQTMTQTGENKFIVTNLSERFDTSKLILVTTMMEIDDSTMTESRERFFTGRDFVKISFDVWGIFFIEFRQKRNDGSSEWVNFVVKYFANLTKISKTEKFRYPVSVSVRD